MRRLILFTIALFVTGSCIGLGIWQLSRLAARRAANRLAISERSRPVLYLEADRLGELVPDRRVRVRGELEESREFLLRGRLVEGVPAVQVITPLRIAGSDTAILVNRGYVPAPDALDPRGATWSERQRSEFHGTVQAVPDRGDGKPLRRGGRETWQTLDLTAMRVRLPYPIAPVYLVAEPDSGSADHTIRGNVYPFRAEPRSLSDGPHLMYAIQWFGIAAASLAFGVIFLVRRGGAPSAELRERSTVNGQR